MHSKTLVRKDIVVVFFDVRYTPLPPHLFSCTVGGMYREETESENPGFCSFVYNSMFVDELEKLVD